MNKSRQRWQCQAPVTQCSAGLAGIREGRAPETQEPPDCGFAHRGLHCYVKYTIVVRAVTALHREHTCAEQGGSALLAAGENVQHGTWVSQWEGVRKGCGFRLVTGEWLCSGLHTVRKQGDCD